MYPTSIAFEGHDGGEHNLHSLNMSQKKQQLVWSIDVDRFMICVDRG